MNQCKKCNSTLLTYVTGYEHLDFESEIHKNNLVNLYIYFKYE